MRRKVASFREYLKTLGNFEVVSTGQSSSMTGDAFFLEATVTTGSGEARVYDAFVLRDGKITYHFTGTK